MVYIACNTCNKIIVYVKKKTMHAKIPQSVLWPVIWHLNYHHQDYRDSRLMNQLVVLCWLYTFRGTDCFHYCDVIMGAMASETTSLTIVYSTVFSGTDQRKHQSSASLAFLRGIHRWLVNSPHKWPVTRKMVPFDDVIMLMIHAYLYQIHIIHF